MPTTDQPGLKTINEIGQVNGEGASWDDIVRQQITGLSKRYTGNDAVNKVLAKWHEDITLGPKRNSKFSPHVNGFYMIWMVHGTWYDKYLKETNATLAQNKELTDHNTSVEAGTSGGDNYTYETWQLPYSNPLKSGPSTVGSTFNMLATDIDIPDITEEYIAVSSRLRNSFVPSRNYFVSDFSISYIENVNLEVIRYHEAWFKYLELLKRGEIEMYTKEECAASHRDIFLDTPFTNAVWIAVFKPFTTDIQLLIKLVGVMPVTMPLKQVVGNRSSSKMTVLNMQYKASDIFYKFYEGTKDMMEDTGLLYDSFKLEVISQFANGTDTI